MQDNKEKFQKKPVQKRRIINDIVNYDYDCEKDFFLDFDDDFEIQQAKKQHTRLKNEESW